MLTVEEAQQRLLAGIATLPIEDAPLEECLDRVLARGAVADCDLPPFTNSAMDGYALRAADSRGAREDAPRRLPVAGVIAAGDPGDRALPQDSAMQIMTGAPLPAGADAVIPVELTRRAAQSVEILAAVEPGASVRLAGGDVRRGQHILAAGAAIGPGEVGLLASQGYARVPVYRRTRVAVLSTGDELVEIDRTPGPG
jgi:molybdopterin molybdotransferase